MIAILKEKNENIEKNKKREAEMGDRFESCMKWKIQETSFHVWMEFIVKKIAPDLVWNRQASFLMHKKQPSSSLPAPYYDDGKIFFSPPSLIFQKVMGNKIFETTIKAFGSQTKKVKGCGGFLLSAERDMRELFKKEANLFETQEKFENTYKDHYEPRVASLALSCGFDPSEVGIGVGWVPDLSSAP